MAKGTVAVKSKAVNNSPSLHHPPYFEMIAEAISTLKERTGSSQPAIAKFIEDKYATGLPPNFKKLLSVQLKKCVKSERLDKVKNSYKICPTEKLKLTIKESKKPNKSSSPKQKFAKKKTEITTKTKRLSQIKTPDVLKKTRNKKEGKGEKMKRLSQVKTPDGLKKKHNSKVRR